MPWTILLLVISWSAISFGRFLEIERFRLLAGLCEKPFCTGERGDAESRGPSRKVQEIAARELRVTEIGVGDHGQAIIGR